MQRLHGRHAELERAGLALKQADLGNGSLLFVTGEAGIGKSRLAKEIAALATLRGAKVVWGRSWEAGGAPPYWPWIQTFRSLGGDPFTGAATGGDAGQQRFEVFDRVAQSLKQLAAEATLVELLRVGMKEGAAHGALAVVLDEHLATLPANVRSMLECASVLGRELSLEQLTQAFDWEPDPARACADRAVAAGIWTPGERGAYAFAHVLLRDRVYDAMPPSRRAELHCSSFSPV